MDWKHPSIIAVTGPPFTGKSNIAFGIACRIHQPCILLSLDHILDSISPSCYSPTRPPPHEAEQLFLKAFNILCRIVEKQLRLGVSVVLDSPFSSRTQLDRLVGLSTSLKATKIVIVECEVKAKYAWQRRFEKKDDSPNVPLREVQNWPDRWFKPLSWDDVTKLIGVCDARLNEPIPGVSRLLVNVDKHQENDPISQAIQCLVFCEDDRCIDLEKFQEFNFRHDREASGSSKGEKKLIGFKKGRQKDRFCSDGHCITIESQGLEYKTNCGACEEPISGAAYTCNACMFSLHKSCAELGVDKRSFTLYNCPSIILRTPDFEPPIYSFPESHACLQCREEGYDYDSDCVSCAFESLVKCRLIPTVIDHDCHQHKLSLFLRRITNRARGAPEYQCAACGLEGNHFGYMCTGFEQITYHTECVLLPYPVMHKHGGREHLLELRSSRDKVLEEYPCDFCLEMMNPEDWYYHCPLCPQTYHLHCALMGEEQTLESILVSGDLDFVIDKNGSKILVSDLVGKTVLLYFTAHWCQQFRALLPKLIETYNKIKKEEGDLEVIFISSDRDQASFDNFFSTMPWLALPFGDSRGDFLSRLFKVHSMSYFFEVHRIPKLVALGSTGKTVTTEARDLIIVHGAKAYPFTDEHLKEIEALFEEMANAWPKKLKHALHEQHELELMRCMSFICDGCDEEGDMWAFRCQACDFDLHPKCALEDDKSKESKDDENESSKEGSPVCDGVRGGAREEKVWSVARPWLLPPTLVYAPQ